MHHSWFKDYDHFRSIELWRKLMGNVHKQFQPARQKQSSAKKTGLLGFPPAPRVRGRPAAGRERDAPQLFCRPGLCTGHQAAAHNRDVRDHPAWYMAPTTPCQGHRAATPISSVWHTSTWYMTTIAPHHKHRRIALQLMSHQLGSSQRGISPWPIQ